MNNRFYSLPAIAGINDVSFVTAAAAVAYFTALTDLHVVAKPSCWWGLCHTCILAQCLRLAFLLLLASLLLPASLSLLVFLLWLASLSSWRPCCCQWRRLFHMQASAAVSSWSSRLYVKNVKKLNLVGMLLHQESRNSSWYRKIPYKFANGILLNSAEFLALSYCIRKIRN